LLRDYIALTKPGIIRGNLVTAIAGYLFAAQTDVVWSEFGAVILGVSSIIAGACVLNNVIDKDIDKKMKRTKTRALATGKISIKSALLYATLLLLVGFVVLVAWTNTITVALGAVAVVFYVFLYGYAKRNSVHGTLVGAVPGALPLVAGYTAASGSLDIVAALLFATMVIWQMPHFYAIGIYRLTEYKAAGLPILSVVKGVNATRKQIIIYMVLFLLCAPLMGMMGYAGVTYSAVMLTLGILWLRIGLEGLNADDVDRWARKVFGFSLLILLIFSLTLSLNMVLP
jgi:heme o synthase